MLELHIPYLLFLGDARDQKAAKTAAGVAHWNPDACLGQIRLPGCQADLGLPDLTIDEAVRQGARTLVVGVANRGGVVSTTWEATLVQALESGMDIASGLHVRLGEVPALRKAAEKNGVRILDVRHNDEDLPVASGERRSGRRLLTVGTDCSVGKMFTSLALTAEMEERGMPADFRATGQTGILITGTGISVDAVIADFISGAAELLSPAGDDDHWDLVEGQGSLFHPSYSGVTLGLVHGSQPDAMVLCLEPGRPHLRGVPSHPVPELDDCVELYERCARIVNPESRIVGLAANTSAMEEEGALELLDSLQEEFGLPAVDPVRTGVASVVDRIEAEFPA